MRKYVNSGKFNIGPVILWTFLGLLAGGIIGVGYTFVAHYIPSVWLNLFALIGMALVLAWATIFCIKRSKSRNKAVNVVMALVIGLFSWYASWATILTHIYGVDFFWVFLHPVELIDGMFFYMEDMQWTFNDNNVEPLIAKLSYLVEFLAFLAPAILVATQKLYYCEFCEQFMKPCDHFITDTETVNEQMDQIREGNLSFLDQVQKLKKIDTGVNEQYKINLHQCESCGERIFNFYHLRMKHKKGKTEIDKTTNIVENIYASRPIQQ